MLPVQTQLLPICAKQQCCYFWFSLCAFWLVSTLSCAASECCCAVTHVVDNKKQGHPVNILMLAREGWYKVLKVAAASPQSYLYV